MIVNALRRRVELLNMLKTSARLLMLSSVVVLNVDSAIAQESASTITSAPPKPTTAEESKPPIVTAANTVASIDVSYSPDSNTKLQSLDIYAPKGAINAPVFVFIHGGGWSKRDKDEVGSQPKMFNSAGIIVVSVNYRLAPAIQHPENVKDIATAVAWLTNNVSKYGGDPGKIVLMGHSAGSHLAALVATDGRYLAAHGLRRNQLKGVVSLDGSAFDIPDRIKNGSEQVAENCRRAFGDKLESQTDGSPIHHVKGADPLPPFLLVYLNENSLNHNQSRRFAQEVESNNGQAKLKHILDGKTHQAICDDLGTIDDHTGPILIEFVRDVTR